MWRLVAMSVLLGAAPVPARLCAGDCDGDGAVAINELVLGVGIALGAVALDACAAADGDGDGAVAIDELIAAVDRALDGCPRAGSHWRDIAPLPQGARQEVAVAALGRRVFVIGGLTAGGGGSREVEVYDAGADRWSRAAPLPAARHHLGAAVSGDQLYAVGGFVGSSFAPSADVYRYAPASDEWTPVAPLPVARGGLAVAEVAGRLLAIGASGSVGDHTAYDPASDRWTPLAPLPDPRNHLAAVALDGALYVVGGRRDGGGFENRAALHRYDPALDRWQALAPMPTARSGHAAAVLDGRIVVMGGEVNAANPPTGVFAEVEVYDPLLDRWTAIEPMALPRHGIGAATIDGLIYVPGGATRAGFGATDRADVWGIDRRATSAANR